MPRQNAYEAILKDHCFNPIFPWKIIKEKIVYFSKISFEIFGMYIFWILLHYICSHLYVYWCTYGTLIGLLLSPFTVPAPHCQALRWVILNGSNIINTMWITLSGWIIKRILI
jgi:hypothetical protein